MTTFTSDEICVNFPLIVCTWPLQAVNASAVYEDASPRYTTYKGHKNCPTEKRPTIPPPPPDYLAILGLHPHATEKEITQAWRRAVLTYHPDRADSGGKGGESEVDIRLVNEARWVLSDAGRRREWEEGMAQLSQASTPLKRPPTKTDPHVYREVSLEQFTPHYPTSHASSSRLPGRDEPQASVRDDDPVDHDDIDDTPSDYTYPCRCSHLFRITHDELEAGIDVISCDGCGEWLRVGYEVVEDG